MRIGFQSYQQDNLDGLGGGEYRWAINWAYFLRHLGHTVLFHDHKDPQTVQFYLDAPFDCTGLPCDKHVHRFFSYSPGVKNIPCYGSNQCFVAFPYTSSFEFGREQENGQFTALFLPAPYSEIFLPAGISRYGFPRTEITWISKTPFHSNYLPSESGQHYISQCAVHQLRALWRLSKRADFTFNLCLQSHVLEYAPQEAEIYKMLYDMRVVGLDTVPWTEVLKLMSRSKLNVPVANLEGSRLESIFCYALPLTPEDHAFGPPSEIGLLPESRGITEDNYYDALETFWLDEQVYRRAWEYQQDLFEPNRDDSVLKQWEIALETLGDKSGS